MNDGKPVQGVHFPSQNASVASKCHPCWAKQKLSGKQKDIDILRGLRKALLICIKVDRVLNFKCT